MKITSTRTSQWAEIREFFTGLGDEIRLHKEDPIRAWPLARTALTNCVEGGIFFSLTAALMLGVMPVQAALYFDVPAVSFVVGLFVVIVNCVILCRFWNSLTDELSGSEIVIYCAFSMTAKITSIIFAVLLFWAIIVLNFTVRIAQLGTLDSLIFTLMTALWAHKCVDCAQTHAYLLGSVYHLKAAEELVEKLESLSPQKPQHTIVPDQASCNQDDN